MKIAFVKNNYEKSAKAVKEIKSLLSEGNIFDQKSPDVVIAVGGDGTFLKAVHKYWGLRKKVVFFAVHSGTLGFYSDFTCKDTEIFVKNMKKENYSIQEADVLKIKVNGKEYFGLNDFRIESTNKAARMDVLINGIHLEHFRGNGLNFSTHSGSTAYNKSLGGSIMWPSVHGFQMTEVAPISNNSYSSLGTSLILSKKDKVTLNGNFDKAFIGIDANFLYITGKKEVEVTIAKDKIKIARFTKHYNFHQRIKDAFIK